MKRRRSPTAPPPALLCFAWLPLAALAQDDAEEAPAATLSNMPTLTSSSAADEVQTVPAQMGAGNRGAQAYQEQQSYTSSSLESALSSVEATMTAAAPWATSTTGMQPYKDEDDTVVVHSDGGITCVPSSTCASSSTFVGAGGES